MNFGKCVQVMKIEVLKYNAQTQFLDMRLPKWYGVTANASCTQLLNLKCQENKIIYSIIWFKKKKKNQWTKAILIYTIQYFFINVNMPNVIISFTMKNYMKFIFNCKYIWSSTQFA